jgi:hypothetical protein
MFPYGRSLHTLRNHHGGAPRTAGTTNAMALAQVEGGVLGGQTRIGEFQVY